jgi:hypothetical protein
MGPKTIAAIAEDRTVFPNMRQSPAEIHAQGYRCLKVASNRKLGGTIKRGEHVDKLMVSLTLEERKTCPRSCHHYQDCYANSMHRAVRVGTVGLMPALDRDLAELTKKYPQGVHVRLHVAGDFYSAAYVGFWRRMLKKYPTVSIFGYTGRKPSSAIGRSLERLNLSMPDRCTIRFSQNQASTRDRPGRIFAAREDFAGDSFTCPEQTDAPVDSCADCGICWSGSAKTVKFLTH